MLSSPFMIRTLLLSLCVCCSPPMTNGLFGNPGSSVVHLPEIAFASLGRLCLGGVCSSSRTVWELSSPLRNAATKIGRFRRLQEVYERSREISAFIGILAPSQSSHPGGALPIGTPIN